VDQDAYSVQLFDHAMVYVPELNLFVDGTANSMEIGNLPAKDLGAMAMTVDARGNATRRTVPFTSPADLGGLEMAHVSDSGSPEPVAQTKIVLAQASGGVEASHDGI
jgi:hypothetical protein